MKYAAKNRNWWLFIYLGVGLLLVSLSGLWTYKTHVKNLPDSRLIEIQKVFLNGEAQMDAYLSALQSAQPICSTADLVQFCSQNQVNMTKFACFVYLDNALIAWSNNTVTLPVDYADIDTVAFFSADNQWLFVKHLQSGNYKYVVALIMGNNYENPRRNGGESIIFEPTVNAQNAKYMIYDNQQQAVCSMCPNKNYHPDTLTVLLQMGLSLVGFTLIIFSISLLLLKIPFFFRRKILIFVIGSGVLFIMVNLMILFFDNASDLFSPIYYASHFNSLGQLLGNVYAIFLSTILFMQYASLRNFYKKSKKNKLWISIFTIFIIFLSIIGIYFLISGITNDSIVILKPELLYQYDLLSVVAILSIVMLLWSAFFVLYKSLSEVFNILNDKRLFAFIIGGELTLFVLGIVLPSLIFATPSHSIGYSFLLLAFVLMVTVISIFIYRQKKWYNLFFLCLIFLILSCIVWLTARHSAIEREDKYIEQMAKDILSVEDNFISDDFCDLAEKMEKDKELKELYNKRKLDPIAVQQYVASHYLDRYSGKYNIRIYVGLESSQEDKMRLEKALFKSMPERSSDASSTVFFNRIGFGHSEYVLNLFIPVRNFADMGRLLVVFRKDATSSQDRMLRKETSYFSYAGYENGKLASTSTHSNVNYYQNISDYQLDTLYSGMKFTRLEVQHTVFVSGQKTLLISTNNDIIWMQLSFIVGLFLIQCMLFMFVSLLFRPLGSQNPWSFGFQESIQFYVLILLLVAISATGTLFFNFSHKVQQKIDFNNINLSLNRVKNVILSNFNAIRTADLDKNQFAEIETAITHCYESDMPDINIYNSSGLLVKSYGRGIFTSTLMSPLAYKSLIESEQDVYVCNEKIDRKDYKSYYKTVTNKDGNIIGFINQMIFTHRPQYTFDRHYIQFLSKFITIGMLIVLLIIIGSLLLIQRLTIPLKKVIGLLSEINSNPRKIKTMKQIEWHHNDEFGELVSTYNLLIERIVVSMELLERNAQEMMWKDMAKQVAHEIKNPLTPMRLTTQQILREVSDNQIDKEKIKHYLSMIVEQIDTLSSIVSSFSDYAKVNLHNGKVEDLLTIIDNAVASFNDPEDDIWVKVENHTSESQILCFTNRMQIIQMVNNLIKNAIQARKPHQRQNICISFVTYGDKMWQIQISDTGTGMSPQVQEKIFLPDFTTKSAGSGLGLAMVKSIVVSWGGSIYFESTYGEGTTFFINLPKYVPHDN
ncbi:MAG: GHKL domain-containing protein [Bacteroidales bacterium]|nr:GHKL domain-containing protein [Bacteroidales bacterium]